MQYTENDLKNQLKPYSKNPIAAFFQKIWRGWLSAWYGFADRHPKFSAFLYMIFFFLVFSEGVTIWQYIVMTFLPYAFAGLNDGPWGWPNVPVPVAGDVPYMIFGDAQGLGYFIAFEIAVFTAQCINFPLQRNITYHSHGNPWYQAMWYFIGWVLVSVFTNAIWGICNVFLVHWGVPDAVTGLLKTVLTGGVSIVIFFFIFLVIFPNDEKVLRKAKARFEKLRKAGITGEKLERAERAYLSAQDKFDRSSTEKESRQAVAQANSKALKYFSIVRERAAAQEKAERSRCAMNEGKASDMVPSKLAKLIFDYTSAVEEEALLAQKEKAAFESACTAIETKEAKTAAYRAVMERLGLQA